MKRLCSMREALEDPALFGSVLPGETWAAWRVLLIASQGEPLTADERVVFTALTGREREPDEMVEELWGIIGRRGGKTRAFAVAASYFAGFVDYEGVFAPGERGILPIMAASTWQASKALNYIKGVFNSVPTLADMVESATAELISLSNGVDIEVRPANMNTIRSGTFVAAVGDEVAFWKSDRKSKNPDHEILDAVRPSLATTGGPLLILSSPHARKGELYKAFRDHHGDKGDPLILVAKAASRTMNPSLKQSVIDRAYKRDKAKAGAEFGGNFREDIEDYVSLDTLIACTDDGVIVRPYRQGISYSAFTDPSGGSKDAMTLAIGHSEDGKAVLDALLAVEPPFSPDEVVKTFCDLLKTYGVARVEGDRYGGEWPRERFRKHGVQYDLAEMSKSQLYLSLLPMLNAGTVRLLDHEELRDQIADLERRVSRGTSDTIDHPEGGHDDIANAAAGALVRLDRPKARYGMLSDAVLGTEEERTQDYVRSLRVSAWGLRG